MSNYTTNITSLADSIINVATKYIVTDTDKLCIETPKGSNRGECIDNLRCLYNGSEINCDNSKFTNEAYCAITVNAILTEAFELETNDTSILKKLHTKGAKDLLDRFKSNYPKLVNKIPKEGCIFYRKSQAVGASGHVGIVHAIDYDNDRLYTIEGNAQFTLNGKQYEGIWGHYYSISKDISARDFQFMHIQYTLGQKEDVLHSFMIDGEKVTDVSTDNTLLYVSGALALGIGAFYLVKKKVIKL